MDRDILPNCTPFFGAEKNCAENNASGVYGNPHLNTINPSTKRHQMTIDFMKSYRSDL